MMKGVFSQKAFVIAGSLLLATAVHSQYLRTSYFVEGTSSRLQLNTGFQPMRGYFNLRKGPEASQSEKTTLVSTILLAGEYSLFNKLSLGAMYTSRFTKPETMNELTISATYRPDNAFITGSYSPIQAGGKPFGLALRLGPLFLGMDYMFFGNKKQLMLS